MPSLRAALPRLLTLSTNLAVLTGLLFVALELRQNTLGPPLGMLVLEPA